jgi:cytochrome c oxidase subunit IV
MEQVAQAQTQGGEAHGEAGAKPQPRYLMVWGVLAVLMLAKVGIAFLGLPKTLAVIVLITLACWKALLVALYYMHLKFEPRTLRWIAASPLGLVVILLLALWMEVR